MTAPERDRWGRPKIVHPTTGKEVGYTRPSTIAKMLSDEFGLRKWVARQTLWGAARRTDIIQLASTTAIDDKRTLDDLAQQAQDAAASQARAQTGTALHSIVEGINRGQEALDIFVHDTMRDDIEAYRRLVAVHGLEFDPAWCEPFVINDEHQYGGSPDAYVEWDGRFVTFDLKTGSNIWLPEHAIQLALYANAEWRYTDGERDRLPDLDRSVGLIVHLPAGEARAELWTVDLEAGWEAAQTAMWVHRWRKRKDLGAQVESPLAQASRVASEEQDAIAGTASQAAAEAGATAGSGPEYSTQAPARDPFDGLTPLADAERVAWVIERIKAFDDAAKQRVAKLWPADVPPPKQWADQKPTSAQLDAVVALLDRIGAEVGEPLSADPRDIAPPDGQVHFVNPSTHIIGEPVDEGPDMDAADVDSLRAAVGKLTQDQRDRLNGWVAEAHDAGYPIGLKRDPVPKRRWTIVWALLGLADLDDNDVRAVLYGATSSESALQESIPIGAVLADLTIDEAKLAGDMARAFGTPDLTMTYNETTRLPSFDGPVMGVA